VKKSGYIRYIYDVYIWYIYICCVYIWYIYIWYIYIWYIYTYKVDVLIISSISKYPVFTYYTFFSLCIKCYYILILNKLERPVIYDVYLFIYLFINLSQTNPSIVVLLRGIVQERTKVVSKLDSCLTVHHQLGKVI